MIKILKNKVVFIKYLSKTTMSGWSHEVQSTSSAESYEINNESSAQETQEHEIRQGIEYIREKKGSEHAALPTQRYEIRQGMEYVQEKNGSQPAEKHKIRQWMEYVREKKRDHNLQRCQHKDLRFAKGWSMFERKTDQNL
ncbi:hypothetical protein AgCh_035611 [Apium graveolens]